MQKIIQKMKKIGFSEKEISVYFSILRQQRVRISQVVKDTKIKRSSVYYAIDKLTGKELITQVIQEDKKYYIPENIKEAFSNLVVEQKNIVSDILPDLKNIIGDNSIQPKIKIYRHKIGMKRLLGNILNCQKKTVRYYISDFNVERLVGEKFLDKFIEKRIEIGIRAKSLRSFKYKPRREKKGLHSEQLREVRFLSDKADIKPYMAIFDNKVIVISSVKEKLGFIIESKDFAEAQKTIFDLLWNNL